jgi:7,8-dihydro-6-hydroxymethylpterin-pyrophosphokinase
MTNGGHSREAEIAVYIGLGSNIGDREANLREAITRIAARLKVESESSIYETEPVGFRDQSWFLNQVVEARMADVLESEFGPVLADPATIATIQAEALLRELLEIEHEMGRERTFANGPRVIDIDLLLVGDKIIAHSKDDEEWPFIDRTDVFVPHPRMHLRRFVLEPLCEIAPDVVHPVLNKTCGELLAELEDSSVVRLFK